MPRGKSKKADTNTSDGDEANLGIEAQRLLAADKLRKNLEPSNDEHVARRLISLKSLSLAFEAAQGAFLAKRHLAERGHGSAFSPDLKADFLLACGA